MLNTRKHLYDNFTFKYTHIPNLTKQRPKTNCCSIKLTYRILKALKELFGLKHAELDTRLELVKKRKVRSQLACRSAQFVDNAELYISLAYVLKSNKFVKVHHS